MKTLNANEMRNIDGGWFFGKNKTTTNKVKTYWYCGNCGYKTSASVSMGWHILWTGHNHTSKIDENGRIF